MNTELRFHLALFRRRLPLFSAIVGVVTVLAVALALLLPPVYRAQALLLVESPQIPDDLAVPTVRTAASETIQIIEQRMLTRANLLDTANRFRIYEGQSLDPAEIVDDMRRRTRIITDTGRDRATLVSLSFDAPSATLSAEVANAFVSFILEENVALRTAIAGQTVDFFRREVQRLSEEMETRSARILAFQLENRDALPDDLPELRARQAELQARLVEIDDMEREMSQQRTAYVERFERSGRIDVLIDDAFAPFLGRLAQLQDEYDRIVAREGASSQRAVGLRARIGSVERSLSAQLVAEGEPAGGPRAVFERQLRKVDERIDALESEREVARERLAEVGERVQAALRNAITLENLERDHASSRAMYSEAMSAVAAAETGDLIETLSRGQRITVIEQAVVPRQPAAPRRSLIAMGGLMAGLLLATATLLVLERLNQTIRRPADLTRTLGIAPFATIPDIQTPGAARLRRAGGMGVGLALLAGVPALLYAVHAFYLPLDLVWRQIIARLGLGPVLEQIRQSFGG